MGPRQSTLARRTLATLAGLLVLRVTALVVSNYSDYVPPNFSSEFLRGREAYFWGAYSWAFYTHIVSGPVALVVGLALVAAPLRRRFPTIHRVLGRFQVIWVTALVAPSGLWMSRYAAAGPIAGLGLASLAVATALTAVIGASLARRRRFEDHRRWMWRCYLLLCSAVFLRLMGGLARITGLTAAWFDPAANWLSWCVPLAILEIREWCVRKREPSLPRASEPARRYQSSLNSSPPAIEIKP